MLGSYSNGFAPRDFQPRYPSLWTGCIGAWAPCLGVTSGVVRDWSNYQRHGALTNMTLSDSWVINGGRYALSFDATNDFVNCGTIDSGSVYCISAWARANDFTSRVIISNYNAGANRVQYDLRMGSSAGTGRFEIFYQDASGFRNGLGPVNLSTGVWYHVAWINSANSDAGQSLYVNGIPQSLSFSNSGTPGVPTTGFGNTSIGRAGDSTFGPFSGMIDDVRLYNRALTANEVTLLASGRGISYEPRIRRYYRAAGGRLLSLRRACA